MNQSTNSYKDLYITTAREHIADLKKNLRALEKDIHDQTAIDEVHRQAHSFKSQNLVMGYTQTGNLSHLIEVLFQNVKENKKALTIKDLQAVTEAVSKLGESVESIEKSDRELNLSNEISKFKSK